MSDINFIKPKEMQTKYICPSIPSRRFDYVAYWKKFWKMGPHGFGQTESDAIEDLLIKTEELGD